MICLLILCLCTVTGQQHEGSSRATLRHPERLYLWQGGVPHSHTAWLSRWRQPSLHLPCGSQLPLWCLQNRQWWVCPQDQWGRGKVYQTTQTCVPIPGPEQLHDPLLNPVLFLSTTACAFYSNYWAEMMYECFKWSQMLSFTGIKWQLHCLCSYSLSHPAALFLCYFMCLCCSPTSLFTVGVEPDIFVSLITLFSLPVCPPCVTPRVTMLTLKPISWMQFN